jgi:predicted DNA-binding transcriptional regulator YafY
MSYFTYIDRIKKIDSLIRRGSTGCAEEIADVMGVSRSTVFNYLDVLRSMGAEISYSKKSNSFYYVNNFRLHL